MIDVVTRYGLDMSGTTDNADKLAFLAKEIDGWYAAGKPLPRLVFTEGVLKFSQWPDLAYPNLQIVAEGECRLQGADVVFDGSLRDPSSVIAPKQPGINNLTFTGFDIAARTVFKGIHRSNLSVRVTGFGIEMVFCIITKIHPVVGPGPAGLILSAWPGRPELQTTACTIDNPCLESCAIGLYIISAGSCLVQGGTIESCSAGVRIDAGGRNMFYNIDMESNGIDVVAGSDAHNNGFLYCGNNGKLNANFTFLSSNWSRN